jgi:hypothetical protein
LFLLLTLIDTSAGAGHARLAHPFHPSSGVPAALIAGLAERPLYRLFVTFSHMRGMPTPQLATLSESLGDGAADELPPMLQQSLARHRENLSSMVAALRAAGLDEASIERHLEVLIASYRAELAAAFLHLTSQA